jgi:hypothetical protein
MNRLLFHTQGLPETMRALPPFAAKVSTLISPQETRPAVAIKVKSGLKRIVSFVPLTDDANGSLTIPAS